MLSNRILHITHYDHTHSTITGGALRYFRIFESWCLNNNVKNQKYITIITAHPEIQNYISYNTCMKIIKYPYIKKFPLKIRYLYSIFAILISSFSIKFKFIYTDSAPVLLIAGILISLLRKKKLIITVQLFEHSTAQNTSQKYYISLINKFAEKIIVTNPSYIKYFDKTKTEFNGYAISQEFKTPQNIKKSYDLCFIGSVDTNRKGIIEYIEIAIQLYNQKKINSAVIITQSTSLKLIQDLINSYQNLFLIFISINQKEIATILNKSKVFLFPTKAESYGLVIGEALKCGVPVITSDIEETKIWENIAICTKDFYTETQRVLKSYNETTDRLLYELPSNRLLNITWDMIAEKEEKLIFGNL